MTHHPDDPLSTQEIERTIEILEGLENLMDLAPTEAIEEILQQAWLKVSRTFPEDFQDATHLDASAEGLRRYLKVRAFFADPTQHPISATELEQYRQNQVLPLEDSTEFFFPD